MAAAWNIGNESFFEDLNTPINTLKLRGSYGVLGNQNIGNYQYLGLISSGINYPVGSPSQLWVGNIQTTYPPTDIKWESTTTSILGRDLSVWEGKTNVTLNLFRKVTSDLLLRIPIPLSTGVGSYPFGNAGEISNTGFEAMVEQNGSMGDVNYTLNLSFSKINNMVEKLATRSQELPGGYATQKGPAVTYTKQGYPMYSFFLIQTDGLFRSEQEVQAHSKGETLIQPNATAGYIRFVDAYDDGVINGEDRVFSGSPFPDFSYGLRLGLNWKTVDFSMFLQGTQGNKIYNGIRAYQDAVRININYSTATLNSYTFNPDSDFPRLTLTDPNGNGEAKSDRFLENGSYLRIKDLQIGFNLPENWLRDHVSSNANVQFYLGAQNLLTFT